MSLESGLHRGRPTAKVSAGVVGEAVSDPAQCLSCTTLEALDTTGHDTPAIDTAIANILTFAIQYWIPDKRG
jgi:hypothetical protein